MRLWLKYGVKRFWFWFIFPVLVLAKPVRIGLALSGGAALGLAHIGVLKVLEQEGLDFVGITGNSMGSLIGGVYAAGYRAATIESIALSTDWNRLFSSRPSFGAQFLPERQRADRYVLQFRHRSFVPYLPEGLVPLQNVEFLLNRLLAEVEFHTGYDFDRLPVPYRAVAVDIHKGELVVLRQGRLEQAIRASVAIPGVFAPEVIEGRELVDGGVLEYLPVEPLLEFQPDFIIAVLTMRRTSRIGTGLIDIVSRSIDLMGMGDVEREKGLADVVIEPDVSRFLHSDFARARELIAAGESAAIAVLPLLREKLAGRSPVRVRNRIVPRELPVVRKIRFEGVRRTRASLLRREIRTKERSRLNFAVLLGDLERLFNTDLFEDVNFRLEEVDDGGVVVVFELRERPYGFYSLGLRYDNYDQVVVGLEVGEGNLWGTGAMARVAGVLGNPQELRLGLTGTKVLNLPFGYRLDGFAGVERRSLWQDGSFLSSYFLNYAGGVAEVGYIMGREGFFNIGLRLQRVDYVGALVDTVPREFSVGPAFNLEFNNQDNVYLPSRGTAHRLNAVYGSPKLGGQQEFLQVEWNGEQVIPVFSFLRLRLFSTLGFSWGALPLSLYFRSGGELAGFAPDEWSGPQEVVAGAGLRFRLFRLFNQDSYPVELELIANGATFSRPDELVNSGDKLKHLHWGAGVGLLTNTPLGPLRLGVSSGNFLRSKPHPGGVRFLLSVGREFRYRR